MQALAILFGIAALYFGLVSISWSGTIALFVAVAVPMLATIRERQGLALALAYLSRLYFRDPSDEISPNLCPKCAFVRRQWF